MMTDLLTRLEAAPEGSRAEHITLFREVEDFLGHDCPMDFRRHVSQAERSGSDSRAMGYLFLAALTLYKNRPEVISSDPRLVCIDALRKLGHENR